MPRKPVSHIRSPRARGVVKSRVFRRRYLDTHKPNMGCESPDVHNTSERSYSVPEPMAYVSPHEGTHMYEETDTFSYRIDGLSSIYQTEGVNGLYRGTLLALVGVSNGALQFMAYERIKVLAFKQKRRSFEKAGKSWTAEDDKLVSFRVPC